ncbi:MAG TPA: MFS transporter [Ramlibacter sp.]|nr:MFS transporter [Ramlibacter sp.]
MAEPRVLQAAPTRDLAGMYVVLMLNGLVAAAGLTVIYLMLATLYRQHVGSTGVGWAVTSYLLVGAICAALCGRLGDLLGRRFMMLVVLCISAAGSLVSATMPTLAGLVVGCALQGTSSALMPLSIGLARENLPEQRVPVALGVLSCSAMFGAGVTYLLGGMVVEHYDASGGFVLKIVLAALTFAAVALIVPRPSQPPSSLKGVDLLRGVLFAPALALALICLELRRTWGWGDARILGGFVAAALLMAYWVRHQAAQARPLIDVRMLVRPRIALTNLAMIFMALGAIQLAQTLSLMLQQPVWTGVGFGLSPSAMGWVLLPLNALTLVASPLSGLCGQRIGMQRVAALGASACLAAWLLLLPWHASFVQVMTAAVICTVGYAVLTPSLYNLIAEASPVERASEAAGVSSVCQGAAMAVGSQLIFGLLAGDTVHDAAQAAASYPSEAAFVNAFIYVAAMSLACLLVLLALPGRASVPARPLVAS